MFDIGVSTFGVFTSAVFAFCFCNRSAIDDARTTYYHKLVSYE